MHVDDLRRERGGGRLDQNLVVDLLLEVHRVRDLLERFEGHLARGLEALRDPYWMQSAIEQLLGLFEQSPGQDYNARRAVADLVVLRLA